MKEKKLWKPRIWTLIVLWKDSWEDKYRTEKWAKPTGAPTMQFLGLEGWELGVGVSFSKRESSVQGDKQSLPQDKPTALTGLNSSHRFSWGRDCSSGWGSIRVHSHSATLTQRVKIGHHLEKILLLKTGLPLSPDVREQTPNYEAQIHCHVPRMKTAELMESYMVNEVADADSDGKHRWQVEDSVRERLLQVQQLASYVIQLGIILESYSPESEGFK